MSNHQNVVAAKGCIAQILALFLHNLFESESIWINDPEVGPWKQSKLFDQPGVAVPVNAVLVNFVVMTRGVLFFVQSSVALAGWAYAACATAGELRVGVVVIAIGVAATIVCGRPREPTTP